MKKVILTGDRPTGPLHLGHYFGSLKKRVEMQSQYETYIMVADVQALTDNFSDPDKVRKNVFEVVLDNLAVGIDPQHSNIFIQSLVPEIAELTVFFSNLVTIARLQRNPTVKQEAAQKKDIFKGGVTYGFLGYPISQAADILSVRANVVPVGEDQLPMLEQTREIARKFNAIYGDIFPEPEAVVGEYARLLGLDGGVKMSKSMGNAIYLSDDAETVKKKVMSAVTDAKKVKKNDKGHSDACAVYSYHKIFSPKEKDKIAKDCKSGELGCVDCKKCLIKNITEFLEPIQAKRQYYEKNMDSVKEIVAVGTKAAREKAKQTMGIVREKMKIDYKL